MNDLLRLRRVRWAVRVVGGIGIGVSITANILHAQPNLISQAIAAWPPIALVFTVELISRVPVHSPRWAWIRRLTTAVIAGIAAWVSYWHMVGVAVRYGETGASPYLMPVSVDGLVVVSAICLMELGMAITKAQDAIAPVTLAAQPVARPAAQPVPDPAPDRPDRQGTPVPNPQPEPPQPQPGVVRSAPMRRVRPPEYRLPAAEQAVKILDDTWPQPQPAPQPEPEVLPTGTKTRPVRRVDGKDLTGEALQRHARGIAVSWMRSREPVTGARLAAAYSPPMGERWAQDRIKEARGLVDRDATKDPGGPADDDPAPAGGRVDGRGLGLVGLPAGASGEQSEISEREAALV